MMDDASDSSLSSTTSSLEIEAALLSGSTVRFSSIGMSGPGGRSGKKEKKRAKKGKGKYVSSDSDSDDAEEEEEEDESDDDEMFDGKGRGRTWADNDEDYIRGVQVRNHLLSSFCSLLPLNLAVEFYHRIFSMRTLIFSTVEIERIERSSSKRSKRAILQTTISTKMI